jgi:hypothetical protein
MRTPQLGWREGGQKEKSESKFNVATGGLRKKSV